MSFYKLPTTFLDSIAALLKERDLEELLESLHRELSPSMPGILIEDLREHFRYGWFHPGWSVEASSNLVGRVLGDYERGRALETGSILLRRVGERTSSVVDFVRMTAKSSTIRVALPMLEEEARALSEEVKQYGRDEATIRAWARARADDYDPRDVSQLRQFVGVDDLEPLYARLSQLNQLIAESGLPDRFRVRPIPYKLILPPARRPRVVAALDHVISESARESDLIRRLSPRDFELFLGRLFESFGFDVEVTARSKDGGVDLLCLTERANIPIKIAIEAKRYAADCPISVQLVRQFVGAQMEERFMANKLVYVTTSRYTRSARDYARNLSNPQLLELKEFPDVVRWAGDFDAQMGMISTHRSLQIKNGF